MKRFETKQMTKCKNYIVLKFKDEKEANDCLNYIINNKTKSIFDLGNYTKVTSNIPNKEMDKILTNLKYKQNLCEKIDGYLHG